MAHGSEYGSLRINADTQQTLLELARKHPIDSWNFNDWIVTESDNDISTTLNKISETMIDRLDSIGGFVINVLPFIEEEDERVGAAATTLLLACLGTPMRVFQSHPFWRPLGTDPDRPLASSGGMGRQPVHIDFVNATNPPDLVCLLCWRPDPNGGGPSHLARIEGVEQHLPESVLHELRQRQYVDGQVKNLNGIGVDENPFAVFNPDEKWRYRYTGKLTESAPTLEARTAVQQVADFLDEQTSIVSLERGQMLVFNQHLVTHGRGPLQGEQRDLPINQRRLLLQSFVRREI